MTPLGGGADEAAEHRRPLPPPVRAATIGSLTRSAVASMSGTAAVCSPSVTSTWRASTHAALTPLRRGTPRRRCGCWRARRSPACASAAAGGTSRCAASARTSRRARRSPRRAAATSASSAGAAARATTPRSTCRVQQFGEDLRRPASRLPVGRQPARLDQAVGHLRHRRHHDHRHAGWRVASRSGSRTMSMTRVIASASATDVPPNFMMTFTAAPRECIARR